MKSVEETTLLTRLEELVAMGKKKKNLLKQVAFPFPLEEEFCVVKQHLLL